MKTLPLILIATLAHSAIAAPRRVDVSEFDIAGIRLGMTPEEAKSAAKAHFGVDDSAISESKYPPADAVTGEKTPFVFTVKSGEHTLTVNHVTDVLRDNAPARAVWSIRYEVPYSRDNTAAMREAALQKYGENSNAPNDLPMHWCKTPNAHMGGVCDSFSEAKLELGQNRIHLVDPRYLEAVNTWRDKQKNTTPKL